MYRGTKQTTGASSQKSLNPPPSSQPATSSAKVLQTMPSAQSSRSSLFLGTGPTATQPHTFFGYTDLDKVYGVSMKLRYHRGTLSEPLKKCYDYIINTIVSVRSPTIQLPENCKNITDSEVEKIRTAINYDFPELYAVHISRTVRIQGKLHSIKVVYDPTFTQLGETLDKIDQLLATTLNKRISESAAQNDYLREMTTIAWMKSHCKYDAKGTNRSNINGFFFNKQCACEGYARSLLFLCNRLGIPCIFVTGRSNCAMIPPLSSSSSTSREDRGHCWNMVQLEGIWYYTDITWCSVIGLRHPDTGKVVFPNYFINMPRSLYSILHIEDHPFPLPSNPERVPFQILTRHNYYFLTGFVLNINANMGRISQEKHSDGDLSIANESVAALCNLILLAISKGKQFVEFLIRAEEPDAFGASALSMRDLLKDSRLWTLVNHTLENTQQLNKYIVPCSVMVPQGKYPAALIFFKLVTTKPKLVSSDKKTRTRA